MSVIKVTLPLGELPVNGKQVSFKAPCNCNVAEAIQIEGVNYTVVDNMDCCVTGKGGMWMAGTIVTVVLDVDNQKAYFQNNAAQTLTVTVPLEWTEDTVNGGYYKTVDVDGIYAYDNPLVDIVLGDDRDANHVFLDSWGNVTRITTSDGSVTLHANNHPPKSAFTMQLKVVR
jgi:hypothetical protein